MLSALRAGRVFVSSKTRRVVCQVRQSPKRLFITSYLFPGTALPTLPLATQSTPIAGPDARLRFFLLPPPCHVDPCQRFDHVYGREAHRGEDRLRRGCRRGTRVPRGWPASLARRHWFIPRLLCVIRSDKLFWNISGKPSLPILKSTKF